jgi:hypothetical protein
MEILQITQKGRFMDTIEKYHIYKANREGITLNDTHTHTYTQQKPNIRDTIQISPNSTLTQTHYPHHNLTPIHPFPTMPETGQHKKLVAL